MTMAELQVFPELQWQVAAGQTPLALARLRVSKHGPDVYCKSSGIKQ